MDKLEIALQEEMQIRASIVEQPLEGLLYDLDLMPEQCKSGTANIRRITVEILREEIERLRKVLKKYGKHESSCRYYYSENKCTCGFEQAPQEGE